MRSALVLPSRILRFIILKWYLFDASPDQTAERQPRFSPQPSLAYRPFRTVLPGIAGLSVRQAACRACRGAR